MGKGNMNYKNTFDLPWIKIVVNKNGDKSYKLLCPVLADFIKAKHSFLFIKECVESGTQRFIYKDGYYQHISNEEMQRIIYKYVPLVVENSRHIEEVMKLIYLAYGIKTYDDINPENLINFENGVLDINTGELLKHSKKYLITTRIPITYKKKYFKPKTSHFDNYLDHLCYGKEDRKNFLLQCMGLVISNVDCSRFKKALIMFGAHDTGKSKVKELLVELIGKKNCSAQDISSLETNRFTTSSIFNKRLVGSSDMSFVTIRELKMFKQITGGDTISAEYKGKDAFNFRFTGFMWFCANDLPKFGGDQGDGVYNRIITLECSNPVKEKDGELLGKMLTEKDYIVCKAIEALQTVIKNGYKLDVPQDCLTANEQYKIENSSVLSFVRDCIAEYDIMKLEPKERYTTKQIYDVYVQYCKDNNKGHCETNREFKKLFDKKSIGDVRKITGKYYFKLITLNEWCINEYTNDEVPNSLKNYNELDYINLEQEGKDESDLTVEKLLELYNKLSEIDKGRFKALFRKNQQIKIKDAQRLPTKASN